MNIFEIEVHPTADIFPMIPSDELQQLADDIQTNGMLNPIVVDNANGEPVLIDGRNRLAACALAGIESDEIDYVEFEGGDVNSFIISSNINRRHLSKGQQAMAIAKMYPKGQWKKKVAQNATFKTKYVQMSRLVLRALPLDAAMVLAGELSLNEAYGVAKIELAKGNTSSGQMEWLEENHPELATMVREDTLTQTAAMVEARQRDSNAEANRYASAQVLKGFLSGIDGIIGSANSKHTLEKLIGHQEEFEKNVGMSKSDIQSKISELRSGIESIENYIGGIE